MHEVPIVLYPPNRTVLLNNTVFYIIKIIDAVCNLCLNALLHLIEILWVYHPLKCISRKTAKFLLRLTSKNPQHSTVGIQQLLRLIRAVNKQPARHSLQYRFNCRQCMFAKSHHFLIHDESSASILSLLFFII